MKNKIILITVTAIIVVACNTSKKSTTSTASSTTTTTTAVTTNTASANSLPVVSKPANGIYAPGNDELVAIQKQYKDVTLDKLNQGYVLYTQSACISCHPAQNIYVFDEMKWGFIIDNMAIKAKITPEQKDAVQKYVLSIKAAKS